MKKFLSIFAVMILGTAFLACDFGSDDDTTGGGGEEDTYYTEEDMEDEDTGGGYDFVWEYVMIIDAEENTSGGECNAGNPGADIDAVELYRDNDLIGWAEDVEAIEDVFATPCDENDKDDPEEMLGAADGQAGDGVFQGYFSLNGRTAYLLMSEEMLNGDELVIYEMFNAANPDATIEDYQVFLGYYDDDEGGMAFTNDAFADWNTGMVTGTIDGLW